MKITAIETYLMQVGGPGEAKSKASTKHYDGGNFGGSRNWLFVLILTDEGIAVIVPLAAGEGVIAYALRYRARGAYFQTRFDPWQKLRIHR